MLGAQYLIDENNKTYHQREREANLNSEWPGGSWAAPARNYFCALLSITGKPSLSRKLMDELELWRDERRPPQSIIDEWTHRWRTGASTIKPKMLAQLQKQYDAFRRGDLDNTIRTANLAHRKLSSDVIENRFNKDTSGALQHLGQLIVIGTEKRMQAYEPRMRDQQQIQVTPQFFLSAPPERKQLDDGAIEAEARVIE